MPLVLAVVKLNAVMLSAAIMPLVLTIVKLYAVMLSAQLRALC